MDGDVTVPIHWLFAVAGALGAAFFWWLRVEWSRNWKEHEVMRKSAQQAHKELDERIDKHNTKIESHLDRIHKRIDEMHWSLQQKGFPKFVDSDENNSG